MRSMEGGFDSSVGRRQSERMGESEVSEGMKNFYFLCLVLFLLLGGKFF